MRVILVRLFYEDESQCHFKKIFIYLVVPGLTFSMRDLLVSACELLSWGMWDLVPLTGIKLGTPCIENVES